MKEFDLIIIGAGAAGFFAAAHAGVKTLVLEKKSRPGNKLLISGQGQCNFTHSGPISGFFSHFGQNQDFIKHALKRFTNRDVMNFFIERGLQITEDKNGKIFPESGKSKDILDILMGCSKKRHTIHLNEAVCSITRHENTFAVQTSKDKYFCKKLIIATGGMSYPTTGSTGDGYDFAKAFGHTIIKPCPSLSPIYIKNYSFQQMAGVSLKDCKVNIYRENKKIAGGCGDVGFTHKGLSGPGILDISRYIKANDVIKLNICGISLDEFNQKFLSEVKLNGSSSIQVFLWQFNIPKSLLRLILSELAIEPAEKIGNITKEQRKALSIMFCELPFTIEHIGGYHVAMATAGGVALSEINPKTMESKLQPGLFFAGEVLDIDGDTGGYNLQAAFSTGYLAAIG